MDESLAASDGGREIESRLSTLNFSVNRLVPTLKQPFGTNIEVQPLGQIAVKSLVTQISELNIAVKSLGQIAELNILVKPLVTQISRVKHLGQPSGSNLRVKHLGQTSTNLRVKHLGQTSTNLRVKHRGQTSGTNLRVKHRGQTPVIRYIG